jgi:hypothetical protein
MNASTRHAPFGVLASLILLALSAMPAAAAETEPVAGWCATECADGTYYHDCGTQMDCEPGAGEARENTCYTICPDDAGTVCGPHDCGSEDTSCCNEDAELQACLEAEKAPEAGDRKLKWKKTCKTWRTWSGEDADGEAAARRASVEVAPEIVVQVEGGRSAEMCTTRCPDCDITLYHRCDFEPSCSFYCNKLSPGSEYVVDGPEVIDAEKKWGRDLGGARRLSEAPAEDEGRVEGYCRTVCECGVRIWHRCDYEPLCSYYCGKYK